MSGNISSERIAAYYAFGFPFCIREIALVKVVKTGKTGTEDRTDRRMTGDTSVC